MRKTLILTALLLAASGCSTEERENKRNAFLLEYLHQVHAETNPEARARYLETHTRKTTGFWERKWRDGEPTLLEKVLALPAPSPDSRWSVQLQTSRDQKFDKNRWIEYVVLEIPAELGQAPGLDDPQTRVRGYEGVYWATLHEGEGETQHFHTWPTLLTGILEVDLRQSSDLGWIEQCMETKLGWSTSLAYKACLKRQKKRERILQQTHSTSLQ